MYVGKCTPQLKSHNLVYYYDDDYDFLYDKITEIEAL